MEFLVTIKPVIAQDRTQNIKEKESLQQDGNLMKLFSAHIESLGWQNIVEKCNGYLMHLKYVPS